MKQKTLIFTPRINMIKLVIGFVAIAALGIWLLMRGGDNIDLGGEKHETSAPHSTPVEPKKP